MERDETFHDVGPLEGFPLGRGRTVVLEGRAVAVFRTKEGVSAVDGLCPHQNAELSRGTLRGTVLTCAQHGWSFDIRTGRSPNRAQPGVRVHATRVENGRLHVALRTRTSPNPGA
jgi:nitrite reductase/ring-hydroxylating ferredoxin subunit